jgi:hypothetical protein
MSKLGVVSCVSFWCDGPTRSVRRVLVDVAKRSDGVRFARWKGAKGSGFRSAPWQVVGAGDGGFVAVDGVRFNLATVERLEAGISPEAAAPSVRLPKGV